MSDSQGVRPPHSPRRGRGAVSNPAGRFEKFETEACDDGWGGLEREIARAPRSVATEVTEERARTIIATNDSPDIPFDRSINPYRGCEHGCIYCFARPSHGYYGLSSGLDFETKIFAKTNAAERLEAALRRPGYLCEKIALGSNTDPYQPTERRLRITRSILEVMVRFRHPVSVVTKSHGIVRDLDLLRELAADGLASVYVSITTLDTELASSMEPRASTPERRLAAVERMAAAGVPCGVLFSPVIPGLNDHELESVLEAAAGAGASSAGYLVVRLPFEIKDLFREWLETHYPLRAGKVMSLIRSLRGGRLNDPRFGHRHRGTGRYAEMLKARFGVATRQHGLGGKGPRLSTELFRVPPDDGPQGRLFD
ncbi:MAG: PA0069 family radical SAM protein [Acidobacteriota bacterium]|nr:PA0069 family radical SAM protein [Acidobacteriota bacterium]